MQQTLHLLIVDRDWRAAMAATCGSKWLLPVVTCAERARAAPLVARWCLQRGVIGDVAGQWLGRVTANAMDWLVAIAARPGLVVGDPALEWRSLDALAAGPAVLDYQHWAIGRTLERGEVPCFSGPFGNLSWPDEVREWIGRTLGSEVTSLTPYRTGAHEVVLGADCGGGRVYCKGLTRERAAEARVTQALAALEPESFARTLAQEQRRDGSVWWLTAACPGRSGGDAHRIGRALARVQRHVMPVDRAALGLGDVDLEDASQWASELLGGSRCGDAVRQRCARVSCADVPASWIPMDLDPVNVLVDDQNHVRFIDLDDSFLGPSPLAMATLSMRGEDKRAYRTYERSWSPPLAGLDWIAFETAATVVQFRLGWQRLERHIARGEVVVDRDLASARTHVRLVKAIDGISPCQAPPGGRAA